MSVAIVTGASRGLGEALATGAGPDGLVGGDRRPGLAGARRGGPTHPGDRGTGRAVLAVAGDVTDETHRHDLTEAAFGSGRARSPRQQRRHARALATAPPLRLPVGRVARRLRGERGGPPRAHPGRPPAPVGLARPPAASTSPRTPPSRPTTAGAATAPARPRSNNWARSSRSRSRRSRCGRSTPATCARRCTRRRSPARTSPTGPSRPASCPPSSSSSGATARAAATAPPNCVGERRERRSSGMTAADGGGAGRRSARAAPALVHPAARARSAGAGRGPRADPRRRPHDGGHQARRSPSCTPTSPSCPASSTRATSSSSTRRGRWPAELDGTGTRRPRRPGPPLDAAARRPLDGRDTAAGPGLPRGRRPATSSTWPAAAGSTCSLPTRPDPAGTACGSGSRRSRRPTPLQPTWPATAGPSGTATSGAAIPISAYQNVYATEPGSAEMPSAGRPFTPEVLTRLVAKGVGVAPAAAPHRGGLAGGGRAALRRVLPRLARHGAPGQRRPAPRWPGHRRRHHRGPRARVGGRRTGPRAPERGLDRDGRLARAAGALGRRPPHRLARAGGVAPGHARGDRRPAAARGVLRRRARPRATCGTSSATST